MSDISHDGATVLRWIAQYYKPETCAATDFQMFVDYIGDRSKAERILKDLWIEELIQPLSSETKPSGGITQGVAATLDGKIRPSNRFVISEKGLSSVEVLFDSDHEEAADKPSVINHDPKAPGEIVLVSSRINDVLMKELERQPGRMLSLTPRQFEEFVAELFQREGFSVELTPPSHDGGRDVIAVTHSHLGTHRYLAECKRYRPDRKIGVELVRSLYGVVESERTTYAVLATTSSFTKGAEEFAQEVRWRLGLKDYQDLKAWLARIAR